MNGSSKERKKKTFDISQCFSKKLNYEKVLHFTCLAVTSCGFTRTLVIEEKKLSAEATAGKLTGDQCLVTWP